MTSSLEKLHVGMIAINTGAISDASAPCGGAEESGFGREGSKYGLYEYTELKTVVTGNIHDAGRSHL